MQTPTSTPPKSWRKAQLDLQNASDIDGNKHGDRKMEITDAREAVERAEDARIASLRKQAAEREAATVMAKDKAQADAALSQQQAAQSQLDAQNSQLQAQQAQLQAEQAQAAKAQADAARAQAEAEAAEARAKAAEANKNVEDANAVREKLRPQLNSVLATSETARGLIVNMSDVLFDTGQYTLKPATQISLAKVAGILQAYPGLKVQVEGYTDSVGSDDFNQTLSDNRASTVKNFLVAQGVSPTASPLRDLERTIRWQITHRLRGARRTGASIWSYPEMRSESVGPDCQRRNQGQPSPQ